MPLLTVTTSKTVAADRKESFFEEVAAMYAETMDSEPRYLSVTLSEVAREDLWLGRATDADSDVAVLEADVRKGRPVDQRRAFALEFMEKLHAEWDVPHPNVKVVFTEHDGTHMMGYDRVGSDWNASDT